ncbi:MAG: YbaN family protein [Pseudomonadota bacterium]
MRPFWNLLGLLSLVLGAIGVVLPLLPTTPFVILAAFAFSKGSPRLRRWLIENRTFGPIIADWERHGAIAPRYKTIACVFMAVTFAVSLWLRLPTFALAFQGAFMLAAAAYVLSRPSGPRQPELEGD